MTFQQLSFVVEVANCESINKAAERLYTSQSNVSNSIKALEEELGIQIFLRTKKGVSVTEEGREFLSYANEIIDKKIFVEDLYAKSPPNASSLLTTVLPARILWPNLMLFSSVLPAGSIRNTTIFPRSRLREKIVSWPIIMSPRRGRRLTL